MKAWLAYFKAMFKQTLRNRPALFWTLFFPMFFMAFFGFIGFGGGPSSTTVTIVQVDQSPAAAQVAKVLGQVKAYEVKPSDSVADARHMIEQSDVDAAIILPDGFGAQMQAAMAARSGSGGAGTPAAAVAQVQVLYGNSNLIQAQVTQGLLNSVIEHVGLAIAGVSTPLQPQFTGVGVKVTSVLDFLVPGLLAIMIMNSGLFSIAIAVTSWRDKGVLKRLRAAAVKPFTVMSGWVVDQVITGFAAAIIMLVLALYVFGAHETLLPVTIIVLILMGMACFFSMGFFMAGVAKDSQSVAPIVNLISLPMMFLSGAFFSLGSMPDWLQSIVQFLPLTYLAHGLRATMNAGTAVSGLGTDLLGMAAWTVVMAVLAVRFFRWESV